MFITWVENCAGLSTTRICWNVNFIEKKHESTGKITGDRETARSSLECERKVWLYLRRQCNKENGRNTFWEVVEPLISDIVKGNQDRVLICDNGNIVNNQERVSNVFNDYFNNISADVGEDSTVTWMWMKITTSMHTCLTNVLQEYESHPSILNKRRNSENHTEGFSFNSVELDAVERKLRSLKIRKSSGCDSIPPKLIRAGSLAISTTVMYLINMCPLHSRLH